MHDESPQALSGWHGRRGGKKRKEQTMPFSSDHRKARECDVQGFPGGYKHGKPASKGEETYQR